MKLFLSYITIIFITFLNLNSAYAQSVQKESSAQIISAVEGTGQLKTLQVVIDLKLEDGWKTYWRTPGESGLAPVFNWSGSENLKTAEVKWPTPERFDLIDIESLGYAGHIIFPVKINLIEPNKELSLKLKLDLLLCKKCMCDELAPCIPIS